MASLIEKYSKQINGVLSCFDRIERKTEFIDEQFGLCYLRVPTWAPFKLQFYCNGHNWLANQLMHHGISFTQFDNAFLQVEDWAKAQELSDTFSVNKLHRLLNQYATQFCPVARHFPNEYHWSILQCEYATDIAFANVRKPCSNCNSCRQT
ncbi:MAG: hypothetical protein A4E53_00767 [Pelotomaculum sp. PtaB.Bin104]|nr:MAG: hypothetical protein A4E53_00767 [Pelotomaculum sp. PtaB.Bin104]